MAINLEEVTKIYEKMEKLSKGTIDNYVQSRAITPEQTTEIISSTINTMLATSFDTHLRDKLNEAQIKSLEKETSIKQAESTKNIEIKEEQKELINRQQKAYNDKLYIEKAKALKDVVFSYNMSNIVVPADLNTKLFNATDAITSSV